ncbi:hypothetical protein [Companilactobacillus nodensis]|uniref:hypothetical protein n=1 Tax=Companilactobacillus nodensis TaxID=460870 RepID=UPI001C3F5780|nr:hypothetical protein [Companilactobacillus nodensis]
MQNIVTTTSRKWKNIIPAVKVAARHRMSFKIYEVKLKFEVRDLGSNRFNGRNNISELEAATKRATKKSTDQNQYSLLISAICRI